MSSPAQQLRARVPLVAQQAVDRARLRVVPRVRTRAPKVPFVALVSIILLAGVVGLLMFNTSMQQASFTASTLKEQSRTLAARKQTLERELEALRNPQRVAVRAQEMGMVVPAAPTFLNLADGSIAGAVTPATAEDALNLQGPLAVKPAELEPERTVVTVEAPPVEPPPAAETQGRKKQKRQP